MSAYSISPHRSNSLFLPLCANECALNDGCVMFRTSFHFADGVGQLTQARHLSRTDELLCLGSQVGRCQFFIRTSPFMPASVRRLSFPVPVPTHNDGRR